MQSMFRPMDALFRTSGVDVVIIVDPEGVFCCSTTIKLFFLLFGGVPVSFTIKSKGLHLVVVVVVPMCVKLLLIFISSTVV